MLSYKMVHRRRALVVTPEGILRLADALPVDKDQLKFKIECADGTTLFPGGVEELLRFPNPKSREIETIEISASYQSRSRFEIKISNSFESPATYSVSGEDSYLVSTADVVEQHLESMTGSGLHLISCSFFLRETAGPLLVGFAIVTIFVGFLLNWIILVSHKHLYLNNSVVFGGFTSAMIFISGLALLFVAIKFERLLRYLFPRASFCIGDGEARYKRMIERRKLFGWGAIVALVIGVVSSVIANNLSVH